MRKNAASGASFYCGSVKDDKQNDVEDENLDNESEEFSEEIEPREDDYSEEPSEEPYEEEAAGESEDSQYDPEELSEEEEDYNPEEPIEEEEEVYPSEATFHKSNDLVNQLEFVSNGSDDLQRSVSTTETASKHQEQSRKRRRSRWDTNPECGAASEPGNSGKRRISRWEPQPEPKCPIELPDFAKKLSEGWDPETQELRAMLFENERLQREGAQEAKSLEKLVQERQIIIARLFAKNALSNNTPSNAPKTKLSKKLYIPVKEYPDYNFVGLIIGPRGHTLKRMMKETGAKIFLRGKSSSKQKAVRTKKADPSDDEDLHVLITADDKKSLDDAVGRVEKLLIPIEESANEHKRAQLRELAELTGTLKNTACRTCGEVGHPVYFCSKKESVLVKNPECDTCGGSSHSTATCPLTITTPGTGSTLDKQPQKGVLGDLGGAGGFTFSTPQTSSNIPWHGSGTVIGTAPIVDDKSNKKNEDGRLLVCDLPPIADDGRLRELFTSFGRVVEASVIRENTGWSKGYGVVKYEDPLNAAVAAAHMNGYIIGGKKLRVSNDSRDIPSSTSPSVSFQSSTMTSQTSPTPVSWPRPPVSAPVPSTTSPLCLYQGSRMTSQTSPSLVSWPLPPISAPIPSSTSPFSSFQGSTMTSQTNPTPVPWPRPPVPAPMPSSTSPLSFYQGSLMTSQTSPSPVSWPLPPTSAPMPSSASSLPLYQSSPMTSQLSPSPISWPRLPVSAPVPPNTSPLYQGSPMTSQISPSPVSWPRPLVPAPVPSSTIPSSMHRGSPMMSQSSLFPRPTPSAPVPPSTSFPPRYPGSTTTPRYTPSTAAWPGPPGSMLPDPQLSSTNSGMYSSDALANFPGNPDRKIQQSSFLAPSSSVSPRPYLTPSPRSATLPFSWPPVYPH